MKKLFLVLLLLLTGSAYGQLVYQAVTQSITTANSYCGPTARSCNITTTGAQFHQLAWNVRGVLVACAVQVDSSADNSSWNSGDVIASQNCIVNGTTLSVALVVNFVRVHVTVITLGAAGSLTVNLTGYKNDPTGGSGVSSVTGSAPIASSGGATPVISLDAPFIRTQGITDAANVGNVSNGQVNGIAVAAFNGDTTPDAPIGTSQFDVANSAVGTTDIVAGISQGLLVNPAANSSALNTGAFINTLVPDTFTHVITGEINGNLVEAINGSHQNVGFMTGVQAFLYQSGLHSPNVAALDGETLTSGTGNSTDKQQGIFTVADVETGASVGNNYGLFIEAGSFLGTITHNYGLWISNQTVHPSTNTDPWSIWTDGGPHHFGGNVTITGGLCLTTGTCSPGQFSADNATAAIAPTTLLTTSSTTQYMIVANLNCHQTTATATVALAIGYTDSSNTAQTITSTTAVCTTLGASSVVSINQPVLALTGTNITYAVNIANAPHYDLRIKAIQTF